MASRVPVIDWVVDAIETVSLDVSKGEGGLFDGHDLMSPYVWPGEGADELCMLLRVLPDPLGPADPTGIIYRGYSRDGGLSFTMDRKPAIAPGPDFVDAGGVEDPTVVEAGAGKLMVFYTGVDGWREKGSLLVASGKDMHSLRKGPVMLTAPEGEGNIKEATVATGADGRYRLFYEYAQNNASRVGLAVSDGPEGPWASIADPFGVREDSWDNWHLSTGPIVARPGGPPVMFYNGATVDARWRIGWVAFDDNFTRVIDRCIEPLILPPPPRLRAGTDIAFAASCVDGPKGLYLYYSLEDRVLRRARLREVH